MGEALYNSLTSNGHCTLCSGMPFIDLWVMVNQLSLKPNKQLLPGFQIYSPSQEMSNSVPSGISGIVGPLSCPASQRFRE